jgi:nucleoside-diphosphate-sugar epimerase
MKLLVTGATGFVGSAFVALLRRRRHEVVALVRPGAAAAIPGCLEWEAGDPLSLPVGFDAVVHLAQSRVYRSFPADAPEMFRVNVAATERLLEAAVAARIKRFCLVSSGAVYEPFTGPITEDAALAPEGYLGASKLAAEVVARPYAALMRLAVLRLFFPYGPGQTMRLVPDLIGRVREGRAVTVGADGHGMRLSPTHVDDVCEALLAAVEQQWTGTLNVAAPIELSIREMADAIGSALGRSPVFETGATPSLRVVPDTKRLAAVYNLARFRDFNAGLAHLRKAD